VRASRQRIVEAGDRERRRVERNLHDGAQQRLVTLVLSLAMLRDRAAADPELVRSLDQSTADLKQAIDRPDLSPRHLIASPRHLMVDWRTNEAGDLGQGSREDQQDGWIVRLRGAGEL
jgi:hypothetical protein